MKLCPGDATIKAFAQFLPEEVECQKEAIANEEEEASEYDSEEESEEEPEDPEEPLDPEQAEIDAAIAASLNDQKEVLPDGTVVEDI